MTLVIGTNCGFVLVAPTTDPTGTATQQDSFTRAFKITSPANSIKVTEMGWWCVTANADANWEMGIYTHDSGGNIPNVLISGSRTNAKGTGAGWKVTSGLSINLAANTTYWLATQLDQPPVGTNTYRNADVTQKSDRKDTQSTLPDPWSSSNSTGGFSLAYYALYEVAATGTNFQINVGDAWKAVSAMQINVNDTWKAVASAKINVGDSWKTIF